MHKEYYKQYKTLYFDRWIRLNDFLETIKQEFPGAPENEIIISVRFHSASGKGMTLPNVSVGCSESYYHPDRKSRCSPKKAVKDAE